MIIDRELTISKKKKAVLIAELKKLNFKPFAKIEDATKDGEIEPALENDAGDDDDVALAASSYDYLLGVCNTPSTKSKVRTDTHRCLCGL